MVQTRKILGRRRSLPRSLLSPEFLCAWNPRGQTLVFLGVDVVGDGDHILLCKHGLAEHFQQGGLARTDGPAYAHAQGGSFLLRLTMWWSGEVMI